MQSTRKSDLSRRELLLGAAGALVAGMSGGSPSVGAEPASDGVAGELIAFLSHNLGMPQPEIDAFIAGRVANQRLKFEPELGYTTVSGAFRNGFDGAFCTYTYDRIGARVMSNYADRPCRINTYGDSFTECGQVSDGETWQEKLAAHLGEPMRNFGVGGYSVYQAYLRMIQKEALHPAPYIVFNIYSEDHFRSLSPISSFIYTPDQRALHAGIRPFVSANSATRAFTPHPNPCPTPASLRNLSDPAWLRQTLGNEDEIGLIFARAMETWRPSERYFPAVREIAARRNYAKPIDTPANLLDAIKEMETADAFHSSMRLVERIEEFAAGQGKRIFFVLSYSEDRICDVLNGKDRFDQPFVDFLRENKIPHLDMLEAHRRDFADFKLKPEQYTARFYVTFGTGYGHRHYSSMGNEFQAFALKDPLVALLDPRPPAYRAMQSSS